MLECSQIRAARALLNWSQSDLAKASRMANSSIKNIENENTTARRETIEQIRAAFENNGVEFLPGSGVKLKSDVVTVAHGKEATAALFDSLYTTAHASHDREILVLGADEAFAAQYDGLARLLEHNARLKRAGIKQKILTSEGTTEFLTDPSCYRLLPREEFGRTSPIYIYGNKVAFQTGTLRRRTIIMEEKAMADLQRAVFNSLWDDARGPLSCDIASWGSRAAGLAQRR
ncbi:MAG: helix-turn-helix transcriptional regulator [Hyphomicrobiaceae bacterium]